MQRAILIPSTGIRRNLNRKPRFRTIITPASIPGSFYAYVLQYSDGSYYISHSDDVESCIQERIHALGLCKSAAARKFHLISVEGPYTESMAKARAEWLQRWSKQSDPADSFVRFICMHVSIECEFKPGRKRKRTQ